MTSSILPPRRLLAPCSPITQASASTTLDLPEPFGPDDAGDARLEPQRRRRGEGLEALQGQALQVHDDPAYRPAAGGPSGRGQRPAPGDTPSALVETRQAVWFGPPVHDPGHVAGASVPRARRSGRRIARGLFGQHRQEGGAGGAVTLGDHLDAAVGQVRRRAAEPEFEGAAAGPPPEPDALDPPSHPGGQADHAVGRRTGREVRGDVGQGGDVLHTPYRTEAGVRPRTGGRVERSPPSEDFGLGQ